MEAIVVFFLIFVGIIVILSGGSGDQRAPQGTWIQVGVPIQETRPAGGCVAQLALLLLGAVGGVALLAAVLAA